MLCNIEAGSLRFVSSLKAVTDTIFRNEIVLAGSVIHVELLATIKLTKVQLSSRQQGVDRFVQETDALCMLLAEDNLLEKVIPSDFQLVSVAAVDFSQAAYTLTKLEISAKPSQSIESVTLGAII